MTLLTWKRQMVYSVSNSEPIRWIVVAWNEIPISQKNGRVYYIA